MRTTLLMALFAIAPLLAMGQGEKPENRRGEPASHFTVDSLNQYMVANLSLTAKQEKKVRKLNEKYSEVIEGMKPQGSGQGSRQAGPPQMPPGGRGGQGGPPPMGGPGQGGFGQGGPGGMPPQMGGSGSASQDPFTQMEEKQSAYEKKLQKILTDEQYAGYEKVKPKLASQRMLRDFLFRGAVPRMGQSDN